jgi:hypothetical protein
LRRQSLGHGIYFWEHSPERASRWAGTDGIVIGAVIQLGNCLDLTDVRYTGLLMQSYKAVEASYCKKDVSLPQNRGRELKLRTLDCLVINNLAATTSEIHTVRGAFEEGHEAFSGAALKMETHIQIAVRERHCILGVFRPTVVDEKESDSRRTIGWIRRRNACKPRPLRQATSLSTD